jgi:hypothetical protein
VTGASDVDAFAAFDIPAGGVFGGAADRKTPAEQRQFGGRAGGRTTRAIGWPATGRPISTAPPWRCTPGH